jgi:D-3-phosphoglycerate dehydrogenase / 2-oxoglutarate reductase
MKGAKSYRIVLAEPFDPAAVACLEKVGQVSVLEDSAPESMMRALTEADALLVRSKAHVTARIIEAAPRLKVIGRASPSVDHIDIRAAKRRNISVVYAPHVAVASTAEFALALMMLLTRRVCYYDGQVREGKFETLRAPWGHEMGRQTVGLLGIDPIAEHLARLLRKAFEPPIIYHDPSERTPTDSVGRSVDLDTLLTEADIISIHLPLTPTTRGLINADRLAKLKPTAALVNVSRGAVVDTTALAGALKKRHLAGAALDSFEVEPLPAGHPIRTAPHCILTPHIAGATLDASTARFQVAEDVVRVLKGEAPQFSAE